MSLSDLMSHAGLAIYAEIGLVLFVIAFLGIAWWIYRPANRARFHGDARIPLDDATPSTPPQGED